MQYEIQMRNDVHAFLDWWESPSAYSEDARYDKIRDISHTFISYATRRSGMDDKRAMTWYTENKDALWRNRSKFIRKFV